MSLNIKNAETERLVRELAADTGESVTVAVRERLGRVQRHAAVDVTQRVAGLHELAITHTDISSVL